MAPAILPTIVAQAKQPFLKFKPDTLSYTVDSFKTIHDRSIGDVLRKLPGIEVTDNGKIIFNGKAISNFYIDGDDLLNDKYNLATKSIAADMVKDVQILENHQPIKVLSNKVVSDKVALNINLKATASLKLNGSAGAGAGIGYNTKYDNALTLMAFKKNYKAINSATAANTGNDIANDVLSHTAEDYFRQVQYEATPDLLSLNVPADPAIRRNRYLFNNAALVNTNNLFKTKTQLHLKLNIYYLYDKQDQNYTYNSFYYLPADTLSYLQHQASKTTIHELSTRLSITSNTDKAYITNKFAISYNRYPQSAVLTANSKYLNQDLLQKNDMASNEFDIIKTKGSSGAIEAYSYVGYNYKPERLTISPGLNELFFNNGLVYKQLIQNTYYKTFTIHNFVALTQRTAKLLQSYKAGAIVHNTWLGSQLRMQQNNDNYKNAGDSFANHLHYRSFDTYAQADYDFIFEKARASLSLPLHYKIINYSNDFDKQRKNALKLMYVTPAANLKYATGKENYFTAAYSFRNEVIPAENIYRGSILSNYNLLVTNTTAYPQNNFHNASLGFKYRKSLKVLFGNATITYTATSSNFIANTALYNAIQKRSFIPFKNACSSINFFASLGKYIFDLHTNIRLNAGYKISSGYQLLNSSSIKYNGYNTVVSATFNPSLFKSVDISYTISYAHAVNHPEQSNVTSQKNVQLQQSAEVNFLAGNNLYFKTKADNFYINQNYPHITNSYLFADAECGYKLKYPRADISINITNIANIRQYSSVAGTGNYIEQSIYTILPRMLLAKAIFNF